MSVFEASGFDPLAKPGQAPIFDEAWHAQVLALADTLAQSGLFTPTEWSDVLGEELRNAAARGARDDQETYYSAALRALERLVAADSDVSATALAERVEAWRRAYLNTPHGRPVELSAGLVPRFQSS